MTFQHASTGKGHTPIGERTASDHSSTRTHAQLDLSRLHVLQRMVGNKATMQLLARSNGATRNDSDRRGEDSVIQRDTVEHKIQNGDHEARIREVLAELNEAVNQAYLYVLSVPSLFEYKNEKNGHLEEWIARWNKYLDEGDATMLPASFGYVIETLATLYFYKQPADVAFQQTRAGTRPDVVVFKKLQDIAWIDITSVGSAGHIFDKDDWDSKVDNYAEIVYPSLDDGTLLLMRNNRNKQNPDYNINDMLNRRQAATERYKAQQQYWIQRGEELDIILMNLRNKDTLAKEGLDYGSFHKQATLAVIDFLGGEDREAQYMHGKVPSVLRAMNIGTTKFGYSTGPVASEKTGDYILSLFLPLPEAEEKVLHIQEEEPILLEENN